MADTLSRRLAEALLDIGAVALAPDDPFTWTSGLRSPVYCDNRLTLGFPRVRRLITDGFAAYITDRELAPDVVAGTATAGIPHAAWLADRLDLPMAYVRSKPKAHGRGNQIEGRVEAGQRVVLIEDLVSTGGSSLEAVAGLRAAQADVVAVLAIFSYGFPKATARFAEADVPLHVLTTFDTLLDVARTQGHLADAALDHLRAWRHNPQAWSDTHAA